ncbi:hypothetical protein PFICI_07621 [Pestalotiopsis fici W106-1]|uniref:Pentatricopeptide repeat domain-containing protein n=1 Tax=Pestalotiopsis fici (strain W106-1 / CGMCC3.15140) TaxID=1229662 RepID=W3X3V2_PESFW|nr:uncharacterized protein PFICI_07621 [Pestalotiopsis fici W106-1]ETS80092.1 hypothetical protein PFICI_07621 [Pestalotiopsis fici W106-1]
MRLVNWTIRDVKPARLAINPRLPLTYQAFRHSSPAHCHKTCPASYLRSYATSIESHTDLVASHHLPRSLQALALAEKPKLLKSHVQDAASFGKWQWLINEPKRLSIETDFDREGAAKHLARPLLIDRWDHHGDFDLWNCLLQHLQRLEGDQGVHKLWRAFWGRRSLYQLKKASQKIFWTTIVEAALRLEDEKFLDSVYTYAEYMVEVHDTQWPDLYMNIVPYFLRTGQHDKAIKWHMRLAPNYYPGSQDFIAMIREFSFDHKLAASFTLQSLYIASPERRFYDAIVPYLYGRGQAKLARMWRVTCIKQEDGPRLHAPSRQFLRYLLGYFYQIDLHPREAAVVKEQTLPRPEESEQQVEISREFMNHVHGKTFGFTAKTYNDQLGARWFASSWVGLELATSVVVALGVQQIGPLSLQSICLREGTAQGVLTRIRQLEEAGISIPESGYSKTIRHFARTGDDELLIRLLQCDIHPDVFDDLELQSKLMASRAAAGDMSTYTLLLASRMACVADSARTTSNAMLRSHLLRRNHERVLHIIDDMQGVGIPLDVESCDFIFTWIKRRVGWHSTQRNPHRLQYSLALCRRLSSMDIPVPVEVWTRIVYGLGQGHFFDDLYNLVLELTDFYTTRRSLRPGFVPINKVDVPHKITRPLSEVENLIGLYIPMDTPMNLTLHPLNRIFSRKWQSDLLRWSFALLPYRRGTDSEHQQENFQHAINVLRRLEDRGLRIDIMKVRKALYIRLAEIFGINPVAAKTQQQSRQQNMFSLTQVKTMIDEAWGSELLPPIDELKVHVRNMDERLLKRYHNYSVKNKDAWLEKYPRQVLEGAESARRRKRTML